MKIAFAQTQKGVHTAHVPNGTLIIRRVPNQGLTGIFRATGKWSGGQVIVPCGSVKTLGDAKNATLTAYSQMFLPRI